MFNPFKKRKTAEVKKPAVEKAEALAEEREPEDSQKPASEIAAPADTFTEWCRSDIRGGIERRERNDIFESYSVFGEDRGSLTVRYFHRYPEHERDFDMSYSRELSFEEFNRRLLTQLDRGDMKLSTYNACIQRAALCAAVESGAIYEGFSDSENAALSDFCDSIDTLTDKSYLHGDGVFSCDGRSAVGDESICVRFRKLLPHDALYTEAAGVSREPAAGYDIENLWIMSVYNRLYERCGSCKVMTLTSQWSVDRESLYLITAEGFRGIDGAVLVAVGEAACFRRFGFYSLDFSKR